MKIILGMRAMLTRLITIYDEIFNSQTGDGRRRAMGGDWRWAVTDSDGQLIFFRKNEKYFLLFIFFHNNEK